ncbi:MAG TPA: ANTAR domain-containing protein [Gammaproteobacteria bacterium]
MQILICAEDAARAAVIEAGLEERADARAESRPIVHRVDRVASLLPSVAATNPDVILVDLREPSPERISLLVSAATAVKRPIVAFVDHSDPASARKAIDAGVAAYVVDGLRKERIPALVTVAVARHQAMRRLETELERARTALRERKLIERAKAILMKREGLSEQDAYVLMRRTAMSQNRTIADLARVIVDAASLLGD